MSIDRDLWFALNGSESASHLVSPRNKLHTENAGLKVGLGPANTWAIFLRVRHTLSRPILPAGATSSQTPWQLAPTPGRLRHTPGRPAGVRGQFLQTPARGLMDPRSAAGSPRASLIGPGRGPGQLGQGQLPPDSLAQFPSQGTQVLAGGKVVQPGRPGFPWRGPGQGPGGRLGEYGGNVQYIVSF